MDKRDNKKNPKQHQKTSLHPKNKHKGRYDFDELKKSYPNLKKFVRPNKFDDDSIEFSNPDAVKALNSALLKHYYDVENWDIPEHYLCPPIPGRADYIHHIAELLGKKNGYKIPMNSKVKCLDIGAGANCIYPIIGRKEYGWHFVATEIDTIAIKSAEKIINANPYLKEGIELRQQKNTEQIFEGIIQSKELIDVSICNPPFHKSAKEASAGTLRKMRNIGKSKIDKNRVKIAKPNFGGTNKELWCEGGEKQFITSMINESKKFSKQCYWFSTLVSKKENLKGFYAALKSVNAFKVKTINMGQGNKMSRIIAWTFLNEDEQEDWMYNKWRQWTTEED